MAIANQLMELAAKVALDHLLGKDRTDEAIKIFRAWKAGRDNASLDAELEHTKYEAANPKAVEAAVNEAIERANVTLENDQREKLTLAVVSGLSDMDKVPSEASVGEGFNPSATKTYVVFSDNPLLTGGGSGRFFHFNWTKDTYRVRDYLRKRILHPTNRNAGGDGWEGVPIAMSALDIWKASRVRVQCLDRFGLDLDIKQSDRWRAMLSLLTESANQLGGA